MSSTPFYQPPTPGRKIVHPLSAFLYYFFLSVVYVAAGAYLLLVSGF